MTLFCHDFRSCMMFVDPAFSLQLCSVSPLLHCHLRQSAMSPTSMKRRLPHPFYSPPVTFVHHTVSGALSLLGEDNWNNWSRERFIRLIVLEIGVIVVWPCGCGISGKAHDRSVGYRGCSPPGCQAKGRRKGVFKDTPPMSLNSNQFQQFSIVLSAENEAWTQEHVKAFKTWTITKQKYL